MTKASYKDRLLANLGLIGVIAFFFGAELIYTALSNIIVFNINLSDEARNLYFLSGSFFLFFGIYIINHFRRPKESTRELTIIAKIGGLLLLTISLFWLLNCVNALWYFSFKTDHSQASIMLYSYQDFFGDGFLLFGLGIWLLIKRKEDLA